MDESANGHSKYKIPPVEMVSDDCEVAIGRVITNGRITDPGTIYYPHVGESVWVIRLGLVQMSLAWGSLRLMPPTDENEMADYIAQISTSLDKICNNLADVVVDWDWTDNVGNPLPKPYKNPAVFHSLEFDELVWLRMAITGETPAQRVKELPASRISSSKAGRNRPRQL